MSEPADAVVLLDATGTPIGTAPRITVHSGETPLHLAFSAYLIDPDDRLLLTRRALTKATWPGVWSNSACGHPRPGEDLDQAIRRRVREELGVDLGAITPVLPDYRYRAVDGSGVVEHEVCPVYVARLTTPGDLMPDPAEVMDYAWADWVDAVHLARCLPPLLSPWATEQIRRIAAITPHLGDILAGAEEQLLEPPPLRTTLTVVDEELTRRIGTLTRAWGAHVPDVEILDEDLPRWLGDFLRGGGKRLRPSMCHWGFVAAGGQAGTREYQHLVTAAAALELLHTFALIHDDVMDGSPTRRGRAAAHVIAEHAHRAADAAGSAERFGINLAILLGDLAHTEADGMIAGLPQCLRTRWYELCVELIAGQRCDLTGSAVRGDDPALARAIGRLKSGGYSVRQPLLLGAGAAATPHGLGALDTYGRHIGEAFALRDDVLGVWGDPAVTGKPAGEDLVSGKPTVIRALAAQRLTGAAADALHRVGTPGAAPDDVRLLQCALAEEGIRDRVEDMIGEAVEAGLDALDDPWLTPDGVAGLTQMAGLIAWRDS